MKPRVLILPGYGNSSAVHWQSLWEESSEDFERVHQNDWLHPVREEWVHALEVALASSHLEVVLVAHSMACLVVAHWAAKKGHAKIKGALLVAPPNPQESAFPKEAMGFEPLPRVPFDFPSILVASSNDPYASIEFAKQMAGVWGCQFVNVGEQGHINAQSALGFWHEGWAFLEQLRK